MITSLFVKKDPWWKRSLDIFGALCGLIVFSPIFLFIAMLIKIVSPGPVLFRQQRIGRGGKLFTCLKFRTMHCDADQFLHKNYLTKLIRSSLSNHQSGDPMVKLTKDPRIIRYGRFLRATGLDELPQLINVLLGHMSLVGPRPPIPYEVENYPHWYKTRFDVLPGLTGLWQVSGKNKLGFNEMMRLDIQYSMKRSFLLDSIILLRTPWAVYQQVKEIKRKRNLVVHNDAETGG
jgi:lipopolysaccharide/colanic/teichoic acid biosynthesis glycosyltransferase